MPFIDLNPSPTVQPNSGVNPAVPSATAAMPASVPAPVATNTQVPSAANVTAPVPQPQVEAEKPQNDLLSRLKSFTNFTKDELPAEGERGLPALEDKRERSDVTLNPQASVEVVPAVAEASAPSANSEEIQEFSGPDFPAQEQAVMNLANESTLDDKLAQAADKMNSLIEEDPETESSTVQTPVQIAQPVAPVSETPVPQEDVTDDIVIGTEGAETPTSPVAESVPTIVEQTQPDAVPEVAQPMETTESAQPVETLAEDQPGEEVAPMPTISPTDKTLPVIPENPKPEVQSPSQGVLPPVLATTDTVLASNLSDIQLQTKEYDLNEILKQALIKGASDVHLNVGYRAIARIDGDLTPLQSQVLTNDIIKQMLIPVVAHKAEVNIDDVFDMDIAYALPDKSARFRVNIYRQKENFAAVFRLIPEQIRTIEQLNLPSLLRQFTDLEQGLILVTGATGSGKSTTIAALVNEINQAHPKHIVTIEDPIEYIYPAGRAVVSQRNIGEDTTSWQDAMRSVLRQDPNVVVIGEMRDLETISAAMTVAETGHLVFATLHTNSAAQSVDRIIDVFPEFQQNQIRTQLANVLTAVVSQKLVPVSEGGRRVAVEIMLANPAVRAAIREHKVYQIDNMIQTNADVGMISMEKSLVQMVKDGIISPEVAQQYANKPADLLTLLK